MNARTTQFIWVIKSPGQGKPYRMAHVAMDANRHLCGAACGNVVLIEAPAGFAKCPACTHAGAETMNYPPQKPTKKRVSGPARCRICGCTYERGCPAGCCWIEADLCSVCDQLRLALHDFTLGARRASAAGILRLFREVSQ
jgi:hypothetical protein